MECSYTMSSNGHNCTDMRVPADPCMKKDRHVEACKPVWMQSTYCQLQHNYTYCHT